MDFYCFRSRSACNNIDYGKLPGYKGGIGEPREEFENGVDN